MVGMALHRPAPGVVVGAKRPKPERLVCVQVPLFIKPTILSSASRFSGLRGKPVPSVAHLGEREHPPCDVFCRVVCPAGPDLDFAVAAFYTANTW
jgi:hypothetical protein